ncbi:hypothetical protein PROFUN_05830 [Planoprotostelium fungivorum]|uniref:Uncharacterized protein n=1 Tax=Planoprotostelium fungivorum TaxID=1890364 RepID=A0A2P6NKJ7_9EUKA|nr:hypothetical protein PROFUN_05830 [Planoprotostelium fungivorum]
MVMWEKFKRAPPGVKCGVECDSGGLELIWWGLVGPKESIQAKRMTQASISRRFGVVLCR